MNGCTRFDRLLAVTLVICACSDRIAPEEYILQDVKYACGNWVPAMPEVSLGLFDIFGRLNADDQKDRPPGEILHRIRLRGGVVVHEFHVPMARAT